MIMGGRGRRITGEDQDLPEVGGLEMPCTLPSLQNAIKDLNVTTPKAQMLSKIKNMAKQIFTTKENMKSGLSELHEKALSDVEFGEKLTLALEQVSDLEVEGLLLRNELLTFIQEDFKTKETVFQSDRKKFLNSVSLLGSVYNRIKVCGEPITILGIALLEYFDLLIKGEEEDLKTLTKQIFLNGAKLSKVNKYELLVLELRKIITCENLSNKCKSWILLAIDFTSNECKPLRGVVRNFYVATLGEEFKAIESIIPVVQMSPVSPVSPLSPVSPMSPVSPVSPTNSIKARESGSQYKNKTQYSPKRNDNYKRDLSKNFSEFHIKPDRGFRDRVQSPPGKNNKKDQWKFGGGFQSNSEHDDRFDREENYYGVQKPRQSKPGGLKKNFSSNKETQKEFETFKTDFDQIKEPQLTSGDDTWN